MAGGSEQKVNTGAMELLRRRAEVDGTATAVVGAGAELARIAPELAQSPLVNPPDELRARLHVFRALSEEEDQEFNRVFQDAIGA